MALSADCPLAGVLAARLHGAREELTTRWLERITARVSEVRAVAEDRYASERCRAATGDDERAAIEAALPATGGTLTKAAELLGMGRTTLWRKLKLYGIASRGDETN